MAWTEEEVQRIRRRYIGLEEDFPKLIEAVSVTWSAVKLVDLETRDLLVTWDDYFSREKVFAASSHHGTRPRSGRRERS